MLGTNGTKWYTGRYDHDVPERPELVTRSIRFRTPADLAEAQNPTLSDHEVVKASYTLGTNGAQDSPVVYEERMTKIGATTASGDDIWAMTRKQYNDEGQMEWSGVGRFATTVADPVDPAEADLVDFYVDRKAYNNRGQIIRNVIDIDTTGAPSEFPRVSDPAVTPLNLVTTHNYDSMGRPTRVEKPGGFSDWIVYDLTGSTSFLLETWKYEDVSFSGGIFSTPKPVTIVIQTRQGRVEEILKVRLTSTDDTPDGNEPYEIISRSAVNYDEYGRPVEVEAIPDVSSNGTAAPLKSSIAYDAYGQIGREKGPDGTITRTTRGMRGRVQKIYRGMNDRHPYWGTAIWCDNPITCEFPGDVFPDNMVLVEKRYYGDGTTANGGKYATGQMIESRRYNELPVNQYFIEDPNDPQPLNDEDARGIPTVYEFDCRNRPVFAEERDENDLALYRTFTWYDHQGRPRLVAEYDGTGGPGTGLDPRDKCYWSGNDGVPYPNNTVEPDVPAAKDIRDTNPFSLREMLYNSAGQLAEERDYLIQSFLIAQYTSTMYEFDGRELTVTQASPGGGTTKSIFNAIGQIVLRKTYAAGVEVQRTESRYDDPVRPANLTREITWERRNGVAAVELDDQAEDAAIKRYRYYWYDDANRLLATADYGTDNSGNIFDNAASAPTYDPNVPPTTVSALGTALVTLYGYDDAGRQNRVTDSGGIVTLTEYDDLGRVLLTTENATAIDGPARHTAYQYEDGTGRLAKVAALNGQAINQYSDVDWTASDGTIQVTEYVYDAEVVNVDTSGVWNPVSTNGAWISAVHYPDPDTGQPEMIPSVSFTYRHDGQVVERTDARGVTLAYGYDARDRLAGITADLATATDDVDTNAVEFAYTHTADGLLKTAKVKNEAGQVLSDITLAYDSARQVDSITQTIGTSPARTTSYGWASDGFPYVSQRLTSMSYPHGPTLTMSYGDTDSLDRQISKDLDRLMEINLNGGWLTAYRYMGMYRQIGQGIGGHWNDYDDGFGGPVTGLDRFGRVLDMSYESTDSGVVDVQSAYGYDKRGNRTFTRVDNGTADRSWLYGYDGLSRLIRATRGEINATGDGFTASAVPDTKTWDLDLLGNWSGDPLKTASLHRFRDENGDGVFDGGDISLLQTHHDANASNEIDRVISSEDVGTNGSCLVYDDAGNLLFDGLYYYIYDAWNRLSEIHEPGTLDGCTNGFPATGVAGAAVERFDYDALGRRIRTTVSPGGTDEAITEHVYGTGAAVLEEYEELNVGTPGLELARWFVHGQSFPDPLVMYDLTDAGDAPRGVEEVLYYLKDALGSVLALTNVSGQIVERYAYDPYGATIILDANGIPIGLVPPTDPTSNQFYHDADLDGDIDAADVAHLNACIASGGGDALCVYVHDRNGDRRVDFIDQGVFAGFEGYDPAGTPAPPEFGRPPTIKFDADGDGWLDLFDYYGLMWTWGSTDPLALHIYDGDADGTVDMDDFALFEAALTGPGIPRWEAQPTPSQYGNPYAWTGQRYDARANMYHFWARSYRPDLGRFMQEDMQGLLSLVEVLLSGSGYAPTATAPFVAAQSEYANGFNLFQYVSGNPVNLADPFGLTQDDFDNAIADIYADRAGAAQHAFQQIGFMAQQTGQMILFGAISAMFPPAGLAMSVWGLAESMEDMYYNGLTWGNAAGAALSIGGIRATAGPSRAFFGRLRGGLARTGRSYRSMRGRAALSSLDDQILRNSRSWHRGTFGSSKQSLRYHWQKHGRAYNASPAEYTRDAAAFWRANRGQAFEVPIAGGLKVGYKIDGSPGGIFSADGKIITFWYN